MNSTVVNNTHVYVVIADDPRYNETFTNYHEAMVWVHMVRLTFGCNAGVYEVE